MKATLPLSPDELLTTTRAVRKRLDLTRPVEREVITECLEIAQQAPSGSNAQAWHFLVVTDAEKRAKLAEIYRRGWELYKASPMFMGNLKFEDPRHQAMQPPIADASQYLADHLHEVPVFVIPCIPQRVDGQGAVMQSVLWGTIAPATWSFMLAARARGLGTVWTSLHLFFEEEAAKVLGVPFAEVTQAALIPVAYTVGTDFKPGYRKPVDSIVHWDTW